MNKKGMIIKRLLSILFVSTFLILSTTFVFLPKQTEYVGALSYLGNINSVKFIEGDKTIELEKSYPILDSEAEGLEGYEFSISNSSNNKIAYQVNFTTGTTDNRISQNALKYILYKNGKVVVDKEILPSNGIIIDDNIASKSTDNYTLKFWIHNENDLSIVGKTFQGVIRLDVIK